MVDEDDIRSASYNDMGSRSLPLPGDKWIHTLKHYKYVENNNIVNPPSLGLAYLFGRKFLYPIQDATSGNCCLSITDKCLNLNGRSEPAVMNQFLMST
jgi:hypothetical protein